MKLTQYIIYEARADAYSKGKKITKLIMDKFFSKLQKKSFVYATMDDLVFDLNQVSPKMIKFDTKMSKRNLGMYISGGIFDWDTKKIHIHLTNKLNDYLRRFAREDKQSNYFDVKKNMFYKELLEVLSHEIVHTFQYQVAHLKPFEQITPDDMGGYLSRQVEIDAYALHAAIQIINSDRSSIWDSYEKFYSNGDIDKKQYKKFVKKVYANIREIKKLGLIG